MNKIISDKFNAKWQEDYDSRYKARPELKLNSMVLEADFSRAKNPVVKQDIVIEYILETLYYSGSYLYFNNYDLKSQFKLEGNIQQLFIISFSIIYLWFVYLKISIMI
jgi:ribonucleotide reductase beta subunit family protein with ferritin-like domain